MSRFITNRPHFFFFDAFYGHSVAQSFRKTMPTTTIIHNNNQQQLSDSKHQPPIPPLFLPTPKSIICRHFGPFNRLQWVLPQQWVSCYASYGNIYRVVIIPSSTLKTLLLPLIDQCTEIRMKGRIRITCNREDKIVLRLS